MNMTQADIEAEGFQLVIPRRKKKGGTRPELSDEEIRSLRKEDQDTRDETSK